MPKSTRLRIWGSEVRILSGAARKRLAVTSEYVRHLKRGTHRRGSVGRKHLEREAIEGARGSGDQIGGDSRVA